MSRLDDVLADIQLRVEQRRAAGDYPPDLERRLAAHAVRAGGPPGADGAALRSELDALSAARRFDPARIPTTSRSRAGEAAHRALNATLARHSGAIFAQVGEFAARVEAALRLIAERLEAPSPTVLLAAQLDAVLDRLTQLEEPLEATAALGDLRQRLEALESASRAPHTPTWWDPVRWVDALDGPFEQVVALRSALAARLDGPVLDLASRRGELLWALRDRGVEATGAESDFRLAATAAGAGLAVAHAGPLTTLTRAADGSLGAVTALGVAGRLGAPGAADLVALAGDKLRPQGRLVVESPEPDQPAGYGDPMAGAPIPPEWIRFACAEVRFRGVQVLRSSDSPAGARPGCYLVIATK